MSRCQVWLLSLGLVSAPLRPAVAALAPAKSEARVHFETAAELYAREDYAAAAREFAVAYALEPEVDTMFAWAQAERLAEHYAEAVDLYERLLAGELSNKQRAAIESLLAETRAELERASGSTAAEPAEPSEVEAAEPEPRTDAPAKRDGLGLGLTGVGAGLAILGGGLAIAGAAADAKVRNASTYQAFEDAYDPDTQRGRGAVGLYAAGGAIAGVGAIVLIAGIVRLARAPSRRPASARVILGPEIGPTSVGLSLRVGGFR